MQNIEVKEIPLSLKHMRLRHRSLLEKHGLTMEDEPDFLCGIFDCNDNLLGAASLCGDVIKGVVVDETLRGTDAAAKLLTAVRDKGLAAGHTNLFIFTKPEYRDMFASMAFHPVGEGRGAVLLESSRRGISSYCQYLSSLPRRGNRNGAIVMNVNPFTLGHHYLIKQAAAGVDTLFIIPVGENEKTRFSYAERLEMLRLGTAGIPNVVIAEASPYSISAGTFPSYFIKSVTERTDAHITLDLDIFCRHIAPALNITERFAGTEPADPLTARYNSLMHEILPAHGIKFTEIERYGDASGIYSASRVRTLLDEGMTARAASLLPPTSLPTVLAHIASSALKMELELTPKPGLVDRDNSGAHTDMDFRLMSHSIEVLRHGFAEIARLSMREALPVGSLLSPFGIRAEQEMLKATGGVNTHRGAIFSMGLAVSATAWLIHNGKMPDRNDVCRCLAKIAMTFPRPGGTHGHAMKVRYAIPTVLDEACKGFTSVLRCCDEPDLHRRLLMILTIIEDSNLYYRGGKEGADYARTQALHLLETNITPEALRDLDRDFTERNLSPGGAADMLALTIFLNHFKPNNKIQTMVEIIDKGVYLLDKGRTIATDTANLPAPAEARENTITYGILRAHDINGDGGNDMRIKFDAMMSHDITYVGIIQTARASGLKKFPLPYAMTNCHNSLCAVGGTINEDDHVFGLSAAKKYGGIYVPANQAVIHQYAREAMVKCGNMILGSDSHTRYGSLGNMGVGEGGGELVKQLLNNTWDIKAPEVVLVWLEGTPRKGIGPHDVAISLVKAVFDSGFVKNKVLEFAGPGVKNLPIDFRNGIDIMTTETTCLSSIWITDDEVKSHYEKHERPEDYKELTPGDVAYYDGMIKIDLSKQEAMIALPFHPSNAYTIHELQADPERILREVEEDARKRFGDKIEVDLISKIKDGKVIADQGIIAGCSGGTYDNLAEAAAILKDKSVGNDYFTISAYPQSVPVYMAATRAGIAAEMLQAGVVIKPAFCGPCFGAGDVPANNGLSIRHTTRNFPNREGSKPGNGQISLVALMDARSIAATAANGGVITAATDVEYTNDHEPYKFNGNIYRNRVYNGFGRENLDEELRYGPNIKDWPKMYPMQENMLLELAAVIHDPVTTTDELIPSGETSSYRSNPLKLSEFALSRRVPEYVGISKRIQSEDLERRAGNCPEAVKAVMERVGANPADTSLGSCVFANRPGDGSAREQAASCQKVLGGDANICYEYATKRYRSNCINWGIVPFTISKDTEFNYAPGDFVFIPGLRKAILDGKEQIEAQVITAGEVKPITLYFQNLTADERQILADGCLMNYYAAQNK